MKRSVVGIHHPNLKTWNLEQERRIVGATGAVTVLHHQCFAGPDAMTGHTGDVENHYTYGPLRFGVDPQKHGRPAEPAAPERLIHIRAFERHVGGGTSWRDVDAAAWGRHIARVLSRWTGHNYPETNLWLDPFVAVSLANEQNIEGWIVSDLGGEAERTDAYTAIGTWNLAAWQALDDELAKMGIRRRALSVWSALAFGHDMVPGVPDSEYQNPAIRKAIDYCDLLADHPYAQRGNPRSRSGSGHKDRWFFMDRPFRPGGIDGHQLPGICGQFPGKPLLVTEVNTFECDKPDERPGTVRALEAFWRTAAASGVCVGATAYMLHASDDHNQNDLGHPELRDGLERIGPIFTDARLPEAKHGGAVAAPFPRPGPSPVPAPQPPAQPAPPTPLGVEARILVLRGEKSWLAVARRALGRQNVTMAEAAQLQAANPGGLKEGAWLRSPWHKAVLS